MKNIIFILIFLTFYLNSISQHIGVYYVGNIKQAPIGMGFTYYRNENDLGFFNNYKYGISFTGNWIDAYENSGVYRIGSWGNIPTGRTTQFITRDIFGIDVGITFKQFKFRPFVGGGPVFTTVTTEKFIEAEDAEGLKKFEEENAPVIEERKKQLDSVNTKLDESATLELKMINEKVLPDDLSAEQLETLIKIIN